MEDIIGIVRQACDIVLRDKFDYNIEEHTNGSYMVNIRNPDTYIILMVPFESNLIDSYCIQLYHHMKSHAFIGLNELYERYTVVTNPELYISVESVKLNKASGAIAVPKPINTQTEILWIEVEHLDNKGQDIRVFHYRIEEGINKYAQKYHFGYGISASAYGLVTDTRDPYADYIKCPHDFYPHAYNEPIHHMLSAKWDKGYYGEFIQAVSENYIFLKLEGFWLGLHRSQFYQRLKAQQLPQFVMDEWYVYQMLGSEI
jgi:hypothetical protein